MNTDFTKIYINGEWRKGKSDKELIDSNPFTGEELLRIQAASKEELDEAYKSAAQAQVKWEKELPQAKRAVIEKAASIMEEQKETIIDWLIKEAGSTFIKASAEFQASVNILKEAATFPFRLEGKILPSQTPGKENRVYRKPLGVIGVISPWNFPLHLTIRSVGAALAIGNAVVVKPSTETPVTGGLIFASIFEAAGLPKGLLNIVAGKGSEIGDDMVTNPIPRLISFTGSTEVGRHIAELAGGSLKKAALELGGNNVFIVREDADIEKAAESAIFGKFYHQGQICMAINRIFVHRNISQEFTDAFKRITESLKYGNPEEKDTNVGPLINENQSKRIQEDIEKSISQGAKLVYGGNIEGNVLQPAILTDVTNDMPIAKNEIFGPVAAIITYDSEEEAVEMANAHPYGLSGAVHTSDIEKGTLLAHNIDTGMIHVNDQPVNDEAIMPFGGEKNSGLGRFNGEWVLEEFTTVKWLSVQHQPRSYDPFIKK
ncbi:aldehyde dehydrogenase (NAD+) [Bacillus sp. OV322]|uniref:aldehyde dehydrogenase family protein n=1 Tax=Bacillus sp. OV322 TaxID=1882764 RepID=UPI0008E535C6|nr:aldehyde dehydrogenase family protein [Bacillus sp. OV322]SFB94959.1 aldehyde dehydrogenase (NAD+) [Bacillus sp. OV322]